MAKNILVLGGTRFVGRLLVQRLVAAGHQVTVATRGRAHDPFGRRIRRVVADRRDEAALARAAALEPMWDAVYDQLCFSPLDAAIAARVFAGRTRRYVMASAIEVYRELLGVIDAPFSEEDINVRAIPIDTAYPWHDPRRASESYVAGKRQAEAYLYRSEALPTVTVRFGHVLSGPDDFTGRLAYYVDLVRSGVPLRYAHATAGSSFINATAAADFLYWTGMQSFLGPVNAACAGPLSAFDLYHRVAQALDAPASAAPVTDIARAGELSPFDYPALCTLDTTKARTNGYRFGHSDDWLDDTIRQHDLAHV
ncbi:MAG: NAD(P)H-binding protein [Telluria sp.]